MLNPRNIVRSWSPSIGAPTSPDREVAVTQWKFLWIASWMLIIEKIKLPLDLYRREDTFRSAERTIRSVRKLGQFDSEESTADFIAKLIPSRQLSFMALIHEDYMSGLVQIFENLWSVRPFNMKELAIMRKYVDQVTPILSFKNKFVWRISVILLGNTKEHIKIAKYLTSTYDKYITNDWSGEYAMDERKKVPFYLKSVDVEKLFNNDNDTPDYVTNEILRTIYINVLDKTGEETTTLNNLRKYGGLSFDSVPQDPPNVVGEATIILDKAPNEVIELYIDSMEGVMDGEQFDQFIKYAIRNILFERYNTPKDERGLFDNETLDLRRQHYKILLFIHKKKYFDMINGDLSPRKLYEPRSKLYREEVTNTVTPLRVIIRHQDMTAFMLFQDMFDVELDDQDWLIATKYGMEDHIVYWMRTGDIHENIIEGEHLRHSPRQIDGVDTELCNVCYPRRDRGFARGKTHAKSSKRRR